MPSSFPPGKPSQPYLSDPHFPQIHGNHPHKIYEPETAGIRLLPVRQQHPYLRADRGTHRHVRRIPFQPLLFPAAGDAPFCLPQPEGTFLPAAGGLTQIYIKNPPGGLTPKVARPIFLFKISKASFISKAMDIIPDILISTNISISTKAIYFIIICFLVTVQYPSQLLLKSILNRLWRWILALLNHFLTVSAVNALTC